MADRRECPECGVSVKLENLPAHFERRHPRATLPEGLGRHAERASRARTPRPARPAVTRRGLRVAALIAVVLAVVLVLVVVNPFRPRGPQVGDLAPDFSIDICPSGVVTLSSYRGSVTVLELMDAHCPGCKSEAPTLHDLHAQFDPLGVRFLSVSLIDWHPPPDTCDDIRGFWTNYSTFWVYGMDYHRKVRDAYFPGSAGFGTPTTYVLDARGQIAAILVGHPPGGYADYANALNATLGR